MILPFTFSYSYLKYIPMSQIYVQPQICVQSYIASKTSQICFLSFLKSVSCSSKLCVDVRIIKTSSRKMFCCQRHQNNFYIQIKALSVKVIHKLVHVKTMGFERIIYEPVPSRVTLLKVYYNKRIRS